jgi:uncharacterized protein (DUF885 family)
MTNKIKLGCTIAIAVISAGCNMSQQKQDFSRVTEDFVYSTLALSPVSATSAGYHEHRGAALDEMLDDYSAQGIQQQRTMFQGFRDRLNAAKPETMSAEDRADYEVMQNQIALAFLEFDKIQSYKHNPTVYVELIGNALFNPSILEYAPKEKRYRQIIRRMQRVPALLQQAKENLTDSPDVWNRVAREENTGNIDLVDHALRSGAPAELKGEFDQAAKPALDALRGFNQYLENDLSKKTSDWRLGKEKYAEKFRYTLAVGKTPEQVLSEAEAELKTVRDEMAKLAAPKPIPAALDVIAKQHATPDTYFDEAKKALQEATEFVRAKHLLTLPARSNLQVIPTPEFMRGVYAVGGFNPAPALEPQLGAYYWITPIPANWPKERIESKLREYNTYGLQQLTIHEAMPGHYVQLEIANNVEPKPTRLLRNIYGNGPYVEGWAVYAQQLLSDEGYLNNSAALRLTFLKQMLRVITNAIMDVRIQTMGMTEQEAMDLMIQQGYQEKEEATAKWQRAQLSSSQLPMYFVGWRGWLQVRDEYKKRKADAFRLSEFHDAALQESAVPLPVLSQLLSK